MKVVLRMWHPQQCQVLGNSNVTAETIPCTVFGMISLLLEPQSALHLSSLHIFRYSASHLSAVHGFFPWDSGQCGAQGKLLPMNLSRVKKITPSSFFHSSGFSVLIHQTEIIVFFSLLLDPYINY